MSYYERQTTLGSLVSAKGEGDVGLEFNAIVTAFANLNADLLTAIAAAAGGSDALHKFDATADPTVDDDSGDGFSPGSRWINTSTPAAFICLDASAGAAVWTSFAPSEVSSAEAAAGTETGIRGWSPVKVKHAINNLAGSTTVSIDDTDSVYTIVSGNLSPVLHTIRVDISSGNCDVKELALASMSGKVRLLVTADDGSGGTRCRLLANDGTTVIWIGCLTGDYIEVEYDGTSRFVGPNKNSHYVYLRLAADQNIAQGAGAKVTGWTEITDRGGLWDAATNHQLDIPSSIDATLDITLKMVGNIDIVATAKIDSSYLHDASDQFATNPSNPLAFFGGKYDISGGSKLELWAQNMDNDDGNVPVRGDATKIESFATIKIDWRY